MQIGKGWKSGLVLGAFVMLLAGFQVGPAAAEGASKRQAVTLEPVTVTAQKQEEVAQETPVSITVMDETDLEDKLVNNLDELVRFVPNMASFSTGVLGENVITMRGITATAATRSTSTGMYIDGVPVLSSFGYTAGLLDVERVEVLRGPQGTLYGKSTQAGVVSIVTARPGNELKAKLVGEGGRQLSSKDGDRFNGSLAGVVSGPIVDDVLFFSLSGKVDHKDPFIKNTTLNKAEYELDNYYGNGKLRWTPNSDLDVALTLGREALRQKGNNGNRPGGTSRVVGSNLRTWQDVDTDMQALNVGYNFTENLKLTSISARRHSKLDGEQDFDFSPFSLMHGAAKGKKTSLSQEFRLNGTHGPFDWQGGVYVDDEEMDYFAAVASMRPVPPPLKTKLLGNSYAGYAHVGYDITRDLKILGGLRLEYQRLEFKSSLLTEDLSDHWINLSPKLGLQYTFTPGVMGYATVSQGYRPGGFNDRATNPTYQTYDPETLWSYEAGLKNTLLDNRLLLNVAVFYMDIADKQVEEHVNSNTYYLTNAGKATSMGAELDFTALVTEGLTLNGGIGYTHAEFDEFTDAKGDYKGKRLPYAPEYTYNVGAQYRMQNGFYVRGDVVGYSKTYFDKTNTSYRNPYVLVNAKIGYEMEHLDLYLYGKNIFDTKYDVKNWYGMDMYSEPGDFGLQAVVRF